MQTRLWKYFGKGLPPCKAGGFKADPRSGRVLRALAVIEDGELSPRVKTDFGLKLLLKPFSRFRAAFLPYEKRRELLDKILTALCGKGGKSGKRIISFTADSGLIYTALLRCYGIDLLKKDVDFRLLPCLIGGIDESTRLYRVMEIRAAEIPPMNNADGEYVRQLMKLKAAYALDEDDSFSGGMNRLFDSISGGVGPPRERSR